MTDKSKDAPELIWAEPGLPGYLDEHNDLYTVEYIRKDISDKRIAELEAAAVTARNDALDEAADSVFHPEVANAIRGLKVKP